LPPATRPLAHALDECRIAQDRFDRRWQLGLRVAEHDRGIGRHLGIAFGPARDYTVPVRQLLDQHRVGPAHLGAKEIGKSVRAQLVVGGTELVAGENHAGRSDAAKLPFVVRAIGRIADDHEGKRRRNLGIGGDQMVQAVFGNAAPDREEIAARLQPEALQRLRANCGRHLGAIGNKGRVPPVLALVVGRDRV